MKKHSLFLFSLLAAFSVIRAQNPATQITPVSLSTTAIAPDVLVLKESSHEFGKIPQGRPVTYDFQIQNTGATPLYLENVMASCGCTTPEWSKDPIAPGAGSVIKVGYNAYADGHFAKTVTIYYNNGKTKIITILGEVYKLPVTSAPENASIQFLKQTNL